MNENPECQLCELHRQANPKSVCLKGRGGSDVPLVIFLDNPGIVEDRRKQALVSNAAELLIWMLGRMSLTPQDYYIDYVLKCYPGKCKTIGQKAYRQEMLEACSVYRFATLQQLRPKAIVAMGTRACEAFIGAEKVSEYEGSTWIPSEPTVRELVSHVWVTYSPGYALEDPANSVSIYRTLLAAAEEAGLKPKLNKDKGPFDYGT